MRFKLINWIILIVSVLGVLWILFKLELWSHGWKDLFFYLDNWPMLIIVVVGVILVGSIIKKLFVIEYKLLK